MSSLPPALNGIVAVGVVLLAYFWLVPIINDDSCSALAESRLGFLNRVTFQLIAGCWIPWN